MKVRVSGMGKDREVRVREAGRYQPPPQPGTVGVLFPVRWEETGGLSVAGRHNSRQAVAAGNSHLSRWDRQ